MSKVSKNSILLIFSFLVILGKWSSSYYFFNESLDTKIIFESITDGKYYYTYIKFLSDFNFSYSFDPNVNNLKAIQFPIGGLIWHVIFFKIIGFKSFIVLEFVCLFLFLYIFSNLFNLIFNNQFLSILMSIILFSSPIIIKALGINDFQQIKIFSDNIYNFRVPRPMISNLYFFSFFLILLKMMNKQFFSYKYLVLLGFISGLSLSSFYYHFIIEFITLIFVIIFKFKLKFFFEIKKNIKPILFSSIIFFIIVSPFLVNLYAHEIDFTNRTCIFKIGSVEKKILIENFFKKIFVNKFILLIFVIGIIQLIINRYLSETKNLLNISFTIFISSILAPFLFVMITNESCVLYHFNNLIILTFSIYVLFLSSVLIKKISNKFHYSFFLLLITGLLFYLLISDFNKSKNLSLEKNFSSERKEFQIVADVIKNNFEIEEMSILTFNTNFMIWSILNDIKYMNLINGLFTSKKDYMLENDLISSFKILNQDKENFFEFIKNKKENWRYINQDLAKIFFYKYQANSLKTFNDSKNFTQQEIEDIKKSSPLLHQQSILPLDELDRLLKKYQNYDLSLNFPDIIILDQNDKFLDLKKINYKHYCIKFSGNRFILFFNTLKKNC